MKYIVELFDGRNIRGLRMNKQQLSELMARVKEIDPALGVVILDIRSEDQWRAEKQTATTHPAVYADRERHMRLDRIMA